MRVLAFLFIALGFATAAGSQGDSKGNHGRFTGQIKAVVYVSDVEKSAPFYRDALGFDFEGFAGAKDDPYYAEMAVAGVKFGLHEPTSDGQQSKVGQQRLYFRVKDIDAHRARVVAWGADAGEVKNTDWMDMFIVRDGDGNEIVFAATTERHKTNPWNTEQ